MNDRLTISREAIAGFCRANAVRELALFGSATRPDFGADSDVDVLIELRPGARVGLVALHRMRDELSAMFGRPVDLVTRSGLNRHIRDEVQRQAEIVYAE
jgi:predicted nucleotidyltransferase